jgi:hypothetical protein
MRSVEIVMRRAAAALLFSAVVAAQAPADFSGRWTLAPDPAPPATQRGGRTPTGSAGTGWGPNITITQNATTVTVEYTPFVRYDMQQPLKLAYRIDGSESRNTINMGRGPQEQISKAAWDGSKLVITTTHAFKAPDGKGTMTTEVTHVLSLESPASLRVDTTRSAVLGGPSSTATTTYKKN